ncbi:MAG: AAA family ATPase [bacterium]|nr:AAA family ATPase [bacterium]
MLTQLKSVELPDRKTDILIVLEKLLTDNIKDGKKTVVVIDEAHTIEDKNIFEELRLLLNFQLEDKFLLTLVLLGQPELNSKIEDNKQLAQRIAMRYNLDGLNHADTVNYVKHRLKVAGCDNELFTLSALGLVFDRAGGIPRRINQICDMCLFTGFVKKVKSIDNEIVKEAIDSL